MARNWVAPTTEKQTRPLPADVVFADDERTIMDNDFWCAMRENGFMLVDAKKRKIAVFANDAGQIMLATNEDDSDCLSSICANEFDDFLKLFKQAREIADLKDAEIETSYAIHCAKVRK